MEEAQGVLGKKRTAKQLQSSISTQLHAKKENKEQISD